MNIIAFSLWGQTPVYNLGALQNIEEAKKIYPGWKCRFYVSKMKPPSVLKELRNSDCEIVFMGGGIGYFWRFFAASDPGVERVIFRDCDSRVNSREAAAVAAWIDSEKKFHVMRDAEVHGELLMLAGMWGVRGGVLPNMKPVVEKWCATHDTTNKYADQMFLAEEIWPFAKSMGVLEHGSLQSMKGTYGKNGVPFPEHKSMKHGQYVGQVIWP